MNDMESEPQSTRIPKMVISALVGWYTTYVLVKKLTGQEAEWTIRAVTALHAVLITALAVLDWRFIHGWEIQDLGKPNTVLEEAILCLALGYFCFDLLWVLKYQTEGLVMYFHHFLSIASLIFILYKGVSAREALVGISGLELTNPCLQARWFLRTHGYQGTWMHLTTEVSFMVTFIAFRILYGSYLTYNILIHPLCSQIIKLGTFGLYMVSWAFVYQMYTYIVKRYCNKPVKESQE